MSAAAQEVLTVERGRRPDIEKELSDKYHVKFTFHEEVPLTQFDKNRSLKNQARFEAINEDTVATYAEAVDRGDDFPAVLAYRPTARGRLIMIDGNHRFGGYEKAKKDGIPVYEVHRDTDKATIALLTYSMNTRHGRPTSEAERIQQAIHLIEAGASQSAASAAVNLSPRVLTRAIAARKADQRADEVGLKRTEWDALAASVKSRLLALSTDEGFKGASELAFQAQLTAPEAFDLVQLLNSTKSSAKQLSMLRQQRDIYQDRIQAGAGGVLGTADRRKMTPKARVAMAMSQVLAIPNANEAILDGYPEPERKDAAANMRKAAERMTELADLLDPKKRRR